MASILTSTFLDVTFGALWWITKETTKGIYYGTKYIFFGSDQSVIEVKEIDIKDLFNEIEKLRSEVKEMKNKNSNEENNYNYNDSDNNYIDKESKNDFEIVKHISKTDLNNNE